MLRTPRILLLAAVFSASLRAVVAAEPALPPGIDYSRIDAIFNKHCLDCHGAQEPEANLVMESFDALMKGGENGQAIVPRKSSDSLLVRMIEGKVEREGKKVIMPPGKRKKLSPEEIQEIRDWIDAGAPGPAAGGGPAKLLVVPTIAPRVPPRIAINALAYAPASKLLAVAKYGVVELRSAETRFVIKTLSGHRGGVNAIAFSPDGSQLFAASGENGLSGEVKQWNVADGSLVRTFEGHKDTLYALAVSPDGETLATGSYDQKIKLWEIKSGRELKTLNGHNGAVFSLAFRPDGKILASASGDRTVKLWDVASGERRDTLSQSLKELYTVAFAPDGKRLAAAGVDNRIRVWEISEKATETTNPILYARYAHEGPVLRIAFSADGKSLLSSGQDQTVKLWDAPEMKERLVLEKQPDWPSAVAFALDNSVVAIGRLDGTLAYYQAGNGKPSAPPKPQLARIEPRGLQRGIETTLRFVGSNLAGVDRINFQTDRINAEIETNSSPNELQVRIKSDASLARGSYEVWVVNANGESSKIKLHVDDLPQVFERKTNGAPVVLRDLPASFWGTIEKPGDRDELSFDGKRGQQIVFDVAARSLGSKAGIGLELLDANGKIVASDSGLESTIDPLLSVTLPGDGRYSLRVNESMLGGSEEHYYRISVGQLPIVTGFFPLSVPTGQESSVELIGYNLGARNTLKIKPEKAGEMDLPLNPEQMRSRQKFKMVAGDGAELVEQEPNDRPANANPIKVPAAVSGRFWSSSGSADADLFRFEAKKGSHWMIETEAAQRGSPADTRIEVLHADGRPVENLLLQAVRNSAVTFRGIDSNTLDARVDNWEEMELNEYLYFQGDIAKIYRMPQGPDSGFQFYPGTGKRRAYFDTTATAHALEEPCYVVEPHPTGTRLVPNGLPVFTLYYANDDDGDRKLGTDSRLSFTAPADGAYLVRVSDARGAQGDLFCYRLIMREPKPGFKATLTGANPVISPGSGQSFGVKVERFDGFDGPIQVEIEGLPPGFSASTPLVIEAGHLEAKGTLNAAPDAKTPDGTNATRTRLTASAMVNQKKVVQDLNHFEAIKLGEKAKVRVFFEPTSTSLQTIAATASNAPAPRVITIAPGETVPAGLRIERAGHDDLVTFTVENLPHGVIVDNIGLNGVLIPKDQNERQIFLTAAKWVPDTDRLCYAIENQAGKQTSLPVLLQVRKKTAARMQQAAAGK